jgi:hypothetical protein
MAARDAGRREADPRHDVWDAVLASAPWIADHVSGISVKNGISLADTVAQFHAAAVIGGFPLDADQLTALLSSHPNGAFGSHADSQTFADDVRKLWAKFSDQAAEALKNEQQKRDLIDALSIEAWCDLDLPPQVRFLGDVITDTSRVFFVGQTGIGKSLLIYGAAANLAAGLSFMHWHCDRPARVLIVDGEMSARMIQRRSRLLRQHQPRIPPGNLLIYSLQRADEFVRRFPQLGPPKPLNHEEGQSWLLGLIDLTQPHIIFLDNVMSLLDGVQKEEETWQQTLPLVLAITARGKSQVWADHTGWNTARQYGTSTKGWLFDAVGLLQTPERAKGGEKETVFDISFDPPGGKARNRDPDHWGDFSPHRLRLTADGWSSEPLASDKSDHAADRRFGKLGPENRQMFDNIANLLAAGAGEKVSPEPAMAPLYAVRRQTLRASNIRAGWHAEGDIASLASSKEQLASNPALNQRGMDHEHKALTRLKDKRLIGFTREWVWLL